MSHAGEELQGAAYTALAASAELSALIGAGRIYDDVPKDQRPPYVVFGKSIHSDWSTDSETGMVHEIELHAWARESGRKEIFKIQEVLIDVLTTMPAQLGGHHLVNLTHEQSEIEARDKHRAFRGISRFRAVSEPL